MAKRKHRPKRAIPHKQPKASVEKSKRKLWYTLAGMVVIGLIIAWGGWYIPQHRMRVLEEQLATLEKRVNTETAWGRKVSRWVEEQKTPVKHDRLVFAPMWYSVRNDTIISYAGHLRC